jgi:hypothetical protein
MKLLLPFEIVKSRENGRNANALLPGMPSDEAPSGGKDRPRIRAARPDMGVQANLAGK